MTGNDSTVCRYAANEVTRACGLAASKGTDPFDVVKESDGGPAPAERIEQQLLNGWEHVSRERSQELHQMCIRGSTCMRSAN